MATVAKRLLILTAVLIAVLVFLRENPLAGKARPAGDPSPEGKGMASGGNGEGGSPALPTKLSTRPQGQPAATHSPARLKEFYLPAVDVTGLSLGSALQKLRAAYDDACRESGEVPVRLTFEVPPGHDRPLAVTLGPRTLDAAIRLLAMVSGLKVERTEARYVFTALEETGEKKVREFRVPPDFGVVKGGEDPFAEGAAPRKRLSPAEWFASQGIELDPSTRISFRAATSALSVETNSAADELAVSSMLRMMADEAPLQHKLETRVLELKAGSQWVPPDVSQLDEAGMQNLFHLLTEQEGAQLMTVPAITGRSGQQAKAEFVREWITPVEGTEDRFETLQIGKVLQITPVPLGFGHRIDLKFTDTTGDVDAESGEAHVDIHTNIENTSFTSDSQARLHVQTRPDGTRTLVLVTPTLIDATGRPVHGGE